MDSHDIPTQKPMASLVAIASLAGVSKSTVSRVINDHPSVSDDAAKAVRDAMERLNYRPRSRRAPPLAGSRGSTHLTAFALLAPEVRGGYYPSLIKGFDEGAGELSHQVLTCSTDNDVRKQGDVVLHLIDKRVSGVAMVPPTVGPPPTHQIRQLQANGIPVVMLHRAVPDVSAPVIRLPYEAIARRAMAEMCAAGHRRICVWFSHRSPSTAPYERGLRSEIAARLGDAGSLQIAFGSSTVHEDGAEHSQRMDQLIDTMVAAGDDRSTVLFTPWDDEAEAIYLRLLRRGRRVPDDVSLVSFGGEWRGSPMREQLTAVTVDEAQTGRMASALLHEMSSGRRPLDDPAEIEMAVGFHLGGTLAAPTGTG